MEQESNSEREEDTFLYFLVALSLFVLINKVLLSIALPPSKRYWLAVKPVKQSLTPSPPLESPNSRYLDHW